MTTNENKIISVGVAGNQIVERIPNGSIKDTTCIACDIDANELANISVHHKILFGKGRIKYLSIESQVEIGMLSVTKSELELATYAAIDGFDQLDSLCENNSKIITLIASLSDTTASGAAPVIAQIAKKRGLFVVAIVYTPFDFEGEIAKKVANIGLRKLRDDSDFVLVIKRSKIQKLYGNLSFKGSFEKSTAIVIRLAKIVSQADDKIFFKNHNNKPFFIGIGEGYGTERLRNAIELALKNTLSERTTIEDVSRVLLQINYGSSLVSKDEKGEINEIILKHSKKVCAITVSESEEISLGETLSILVIAY